MIRLGHLFIEGFRGLMQARLMTFVSVLTIAVALFCMGAAALVLTVVQQRLDDVSLNVCMVAYLDDQTSSDTAKAKSLVADVSHLPQSLAVKLIDKNAAKSRFEERYGREMLESVDGNPLPASLEISLRPDKLGSKDVEAVKTALSAMPGIEGVDYSREFVEKLAAFRKKFLMICSIVVPLLLVALFVIITNTIRLTIFARRDLIVNMRYVGATDMFIRLPFIFEGTIQGFLGGVLAAVALSAARLVALGQHIDTGGNSVFVAMIGIGAIVGCVASMSAVRRFLV